MALQNWVHQDKAKKLLMNSCNVFKRPFHILTITLLSLLLPLSFLLLARFSCYNYLLTFTPDNLAQPVPPSSFCFSWLLFTNPVILYPLVSAVSVATLVHGLTGKLSLLNDSPAGASRQYLCAAWIFLCTLQVCVGLGVDGSVTAGIDGWSFDTGRSLWSRVIFFLGLHETMTYWSRTVVKPVVDDTIFGGVREERWVQRVAMAVSLGTFWWWRLRDEVESLVIAAETKKEMVGVVDMVGWWLYYLTVTIGMVRVVKGLMWVGMILLCKRVRRRNSDGDFPVVGIEEKV